MTKVQELLYRMPTQQDVLLSNLVVVQQDWGNCKLRSTILLLQQHRSGSEDMPHSVRRVSQATIRQEIV